MATDPNGKIGQRHVRLDDTLRLGNGRSFLGLLPRLRGSRNAGNHIGRQGGRSTCPLRRQQIDIERVFGLFAVGPEIGLQREAQRLAITVLASRRDVAWQLVHKRVEIDGDRSVKGKHENAGIHFDAMLRHGLRKRNDHAPIAVLLDQIEAFRRNLCRRTERRENQKQSERDRAGKPAMPRRIAMPFVDRHMSMDFAHTRRALLQLLPISPGVLPACGQSTVRSVKWCLRSHGFSRISWRFCPRKGPLPALPAHADP